MQNAATGRGTEPGGPATATHDALDGTVEEAAGAAPPQRAKWRRLLIIALPPLLGAAGAGIWFSGLLSRPAPKAEAQTPIYVDLPEVVTNLNGGNPRRPSYVKLRMQAEVEGPDNARAVQTAMPRLLDLLQTYVRETRPEELHGAAGTYRLREELLARANIAVAPARVRDLLFADLVIQ